MITIEEIRERIGKNRDGSWEEKVGYNGLDMSGYRSDGKKDGFEGDDRSKDGNKECQYRNFMLLKNIFADEFNELEFKNFNIHSWKGSIWWGNSIFSFKNFDYQKCCDQDFTSQDTEYIINWMLNNKKLWNSVDIKLQKEEQENFDEWLRECINENEKFDESYSCNHGICRLVTNQQRYNTLKRQKWRCIFCNERLKFNKHSGWEGEVAHIDHIHPYSKRFSYPNGVENINESENLQALCPKCNLGKGKKKIN